MIADDFWCRHLVAMRGALEQAEGAAREIPRMAVRGIIIEAIVLVACRFSVGSIQGFAMAMFVKMRFMASAI